MSSSKEKSFKDLLDKQYSWPADYLFKFIVENKHKKELLTTLGSAKAIEKPSSKGKYISISIRMLMHSADEIMELYAKASKIKTVISL